MAIAKNGLYGTHTGKIDNLVYYELNGKNVVRKIGKSLKPPTTLQLKTRMEITIVSKFLSNLLDFINTGFSIECPGTSKNAYNLAMEYNKKTIVKGTYPDLEIAYDKVMLSKGGLKPAENRTVTQITGGLQFNWDTNPQMAWPESSDQVMMLAYFPEQEKAVYTLFGNSRLSGSAVLEIPAGLQDQRMETYISFIAADRKQLANSAYTGSFNL